VGRAERLRRALGRHAATPDFCATQSGDLGVKFTMNTFGSIRV
jgi:hypothetical protein